MNLASPFRPGDKVVAYCRYSEGDEQGLKNQSTEEQAAAIRLFCENNSLTLVRVFADPFASGRSVAKRDHYLEMLSFLLHKKKPDVQGVVLWDFERYGRNYDQAQLDAARLRMAGYKLFSLQQPIMDDGPFAHVLEAMYFASAQNQSDMISADVKRALQHNFLTYKVIPSSCIGWGWKKEPVDMGFLSDGSPRVGHRAVPDPDKVEKIREAVDLRLSGGSLSDCRFLLGIRTNGQVERLFSKTLLFGQLSYGGTVMENYCDPIITREKWSHLQVQNEQLRKRQKGRQGGWSKDVPMLSGLLYCAECGGPMYLYRRTSKGHLYERYYCEASCFRGVYKDELEELVINAVTNALTPEKIEEHRQFIPQLCQSQKPAALSEKQVIARLGLINEQIHNITEAIAKGVQSEALFLKLEALESEKQALVSPEEPAQDQTADELFAQVSHISASVRTLLLSNVPDATKKTALDLCVRSILVDSSGKVRIDLFLPGLPQVGGSSGGNVTAPPEGDSFILQLAEQLLSFLPL